jgi:puromycin-sensitive aminopeptidase
MEMVAVDAWKPEWERWVNFGVSRAAAFGIDGLRASRPIEFPVEAPRDCEAMFDLLTYEKGASVLRMLEQYLGPDTFRDGVRLYLRRHAYANAETTDLWDALGQASRQPIPQVMDGWVFRPGYPLVSVEEGPGGGLRLTQRRFTYLGGDEGSAGPWRVPVTVRASAGGQVVEQRVLLDGAETTLRLPDRPEWVVANAGGHGFYRVRYAPALRERLLAALDRAAPIERFNLVSDLMALCQAGMLPAAEYLELTARFRDETDRNVWTVLIGSFAYVNRTIDDGARPGLAALVRDRLLPAAARLGWEPRPGESELTRQLRGDLLRALGTLGEDPEVRAEARRRYARYREDERALDPNVLPAVIATLAASGGEPEYAVFGERFRQARTPQEEQRYLYALAAFRDPDLVRRTLAFTLDGTVRTQDAPFVLRNLLLGVDSRELAWAFVQRHWDVMAERYPESGLRRMCEGLTGLATPRLEAEVRAFVAERKPALGGKVLEQYLEQLRVAVTFGERAAAPGTAFPP